MNMYNYLNILLICRYIHSLDYCDKSWNTPCYLCKQSQLPQVRIIVVVVAGLLDSEHFAGFPGSTWLARISSEWSMLPVNYWNGRSWIQFHKKMSTSAFNSSMVSIASKALLVCRRRRIMFLLYLDDWLDRVLVCAKKVVILDTGHHLTSHPTDIKNIRMCKSLNFVIKITLLQKL